MKAEGRKETIRQFKVSAAGFMASVVLAGCNTTQGRPSRADNYPGAERSQWQQKKAKQSFSSCNKIVKKV